MAKRKRTERALSAPASTFRWPLRVAAGGIAIALRVAMKNLNSYIGISASSVLLIAACHRDAPPDNASTTSASQQPTTSSAGGNGTRSDTAHSTDSASSMSPTGTTGATGATGAVGGGTGTDQAATGNNTGANGAQGQAMGVSGGATMSDAQLLQITHFANAGEIAQAKLAQQKSKNADVKKLAQMMLTQHGDADKKGMDLAKKENITLADSEVSADLKKTADGMTTEMTSKTGADFDKSYVDAQVKEHQAVLEILDTKLIPVARDAEVKAYLKDVRTAVAMHLDHAKELQGRIGTK